MAVLVRVTDAQRLAALELDPSGTLDLEEKGLDRIVDPKNLLSGDGRGAASDFGARVVRHDALSLDAPAQAHAAQIRVGRGKVDGEQVVRRTVERIKKWRAPDAAAAQERVVVTRDQPLDRAVAV